MSGRGRAGPRRRRRRPRRRPRPARRHAVAPRPDAARSDAATPQPQRRAGDGAGGRADDDLGACAGSQPTSCSSAASTPAWKAWPTMPPAPSTSPVLVMADRSTLGVPAVLPTPLAASRPHQIPSCSVRAARSATSSHAVPPRGPVVRTCSRSTGIARAAPRSSRTPDRAVALAALDARLLPRSALGAPEPHPVARAQPDLEQRALGERGRGGGLRRRHDSASADPALQLAHPAEPPVVVAGLALEVGEHLGVGKDQEGLGPQPLHDRLGDVLGLDRPLRQHHGAGGVVRAGQEHVRAHALRDTGTTP